MMFKHFSRFLSSKIGLKKKLKLLYYDSLISLLSIWCISGPNAVIYSNRKLLTLSVDVVDWRHFNPRPFPYEGCGKVTFYSFVSELTVSGLTVTAVKSQTWSTVSSRICCVSSISSSTSRNMSFRLTGPRSTESREISASASPFQNKDRDRDRERDRETHSGFIFIILDLPPAQTTSFWVRVAETRSRERRNREDGGVENLRWERK